MGNPSSQLENCLKRLTIMTKSLLYFLLVFFALSINSGSALNCMFCSEGGGNGRCGEGEIGTSTECSYETISCMKNTCNVENGTQIQRGCAITEEVIGHQESCFDQEINGYQCTTCYCDD